MCGCVGSLEHCCILYRGCRSSLLKLLYSSRTTSCHRLSYWQLKLHCGWVCVCVFGILTCINFLHVRSLTCLEVPAMRYSFLYIVYTLVCVCVCVCVCCRCTCVLAADGGTAGPDRAVADNEEFCRCVVNSNGDLASVRSHTVTLLLLSCLALHTHSARTATFDPCHRD